MGLALLASSTVLLGGCASDLTRTGSSPAFVIIDSLQGAPGAEPDKFGTPLLSDVQTFGGIFDDFGRVRARVSLKNPGTVTTPTAPSPLNAVTLTRYRVTFRRADGRNTPGVDVPHPFDGAVTVTIPEEGTASFTFEVVRHQAKAEAPLLALRGLGGALLISTIAEIQFFGRDQAGNEVVVDGTLGVNFGDFADPQQ